VSRQEVVIVPYRDGPYVVRGPVALRDQYGEAVKLERRPIALCRCGKSRMRPFCDGTHRLIRFRAPSEPESASASLARDPENPGRVDGHVSQPHRELARLALSRTQQILDLDGQGPGKSGSLTAGTRIGPLVKGALLLLNSPSQKRDGSDEAATFLIQGALQESLSCAGAEEPQIIQALAELRRAAEHLEQ
jgi:CDGSH-type Zn-finger protein